ncbi:MAG TPA: hypothetical protein VHC90_18975 [Bryobacteraceae bacterium]|nr:hypothetical protein [Bryobacteraceae bacterium]
MGVLLAQKTQQDKLSQTLKLPEDPPLVAVGETGRLTFQVSPLSGKGLLSEQTREALKAILKLNGNSPIIHIRAFSAGSGDLRRIPQIVADVLGDKHWPLPSISVIQAGALAQDDAQVVLEAVSQSKKEVSKEGLTFLPAETVTAEKPDSPVKPLLQKAIDQLAGKISGQPAAVTCYVSMFENGQDLLRMVQARFAGAAVNLVQPRRLPWRTAAACEGVARTGTSATRLAFSGTQVAFGPEEKDAALAAERLDRALAEAGASATKDAALVRFYILTPEAGAMAQKQAPGALIPVENVAASTAGFALDAVAPVR